MGFLLPKANQRYEVTKDCKIIVPTSRYGNVNNLMNMFLRGWPNIFPPDMIIHRSGKSYMDGVPEVELEMPMGCIFKISRIHMSQHHNDFTMNIALKDNTKFISNASISGLLQKYYPNLNSSDYIWKYTSNRLNIDLNVDSLIDLECIEYNG